MRSHFAAWMMAVMVAGLASAVRPVAAAETYAYDPVHSSISFKARHQDISWIHGRFNKAEGTFVIDGDDPAKSSFTLSIEVASVDTANAARDEHLRQPDYFDAKQFPTIDFKSTSVKPIKGGYEVTGDFTMRGKTKQVTFELQGGKQIEFKGTKRIGFSVTPLSVKRSDFGFDKNNIGPIGDEAMVLIDFEGTKK